jgi:glycosyltransferase involved in cell wall biosynthesis
LPVRLPALLRLRGIPVVQTWHEHVPNEGRLVDLAYATVRDLPRALFGRDVIVVRPDFERCLPLWYRVPGLRKRYHLIHNGPPFPRIELDDAERASVRQRWSADGKRMLVFFGFCYEHKGIDDALEAMDPEHHHLVIAGSIKESDPYQAGLVRRLHSAPLAGHVTTTGFLAPADAARVLAAADAVVLPFRTGGGSWNTSLKAAALQGTFVLTTSTERHGFDPEANVYWARPRDPADLAEALRLHAGSRVARPSPDLVGPDWPEIARRHVDVYRSNV